MDLERYRIVDPSEIREVVGEYVKAKDPDEFLRVLTAVQVLCDVLASRGIVFACAPPHN